MKVTVSKGDVDMKNLRDVTGAKEFRNRVFESVKKVDKSISDDDLYFSQMRNGYSLAYMPCYPKTSNADFIVYQDLDGSIRLSGNLYSMIPTIRKFTDIDDFERNLKNDY